MIINDIKVERNFCHTVVEAKFDNVSILTIGRGSYMEGASIRSTLPASILIGQFCSISSGLLCMMQQNDYSRVTTSSDIMVAPLPTLALCPRHPLRGQIIIQNDVCIGPNVTVMAGVVIGNGAVVLGNSCVEGNIPPYAVAGGNPARVIEYRFSKEQIKNLQNIAWWDWSDDIIMARKPDFSLPIQDFIDTYKRPTPGKIEKDFRRILFFPDFGMEYCFWRHVIGAYCDECRKNASPAGGGAEFLIYIPEDKETDNHIDELESFLKGRYDGTGDINVQVGQIADESELFAVSDSYITSRAYETVTRTCMADRFGVTILSGADWPIRFASAK